MKFLFIIFLAISCHAHSEVKNNIPSVKINSYEFTDPKNPYGVKYFIKMHTKPPVCLIQFSPNGRESMARITCTEMNEIIKNLEVGE